MKKLTGFVAIALVLLVAVYSILKLYGIELFEAQQLYKLFITIGIVSVASILLLILYPFFFSNHFKGYNKAEGNVAHPKN